MRLRVAYGSAWQSIVHRAAPQAARWTMRVGAALVALSPLWACTTDVEDPKPDCADDPLLCPSSVKTATRVACNCECQLPRIPLSTKNRRYRGKMLACLPAGLNPGLGAPEDKQALNDLSPSDYNQKVFKYCSEDIAEWLSLTVKSQLARFDEVPAGLACQPQECTCSTEGANVTYLPCQQDCEERECSNQNCQPILRQGGILDLSSCLCSRTKACGFTSPPSNKPGICRPVVGALDPNILQDRNVEISACAGSDDGACAASL